MKFTNGYWMDRAGYAVRKARGLRDLAVEDDGAVVAHAPVRPVATRGDTLNVGLLSTSFRAVADGVIRVELVHHRGAPDRGPRFEVAGEAGFTGVVETIEADGAGVVDGADGAGGRAVTLRAGSLAVTVREGEDWTAEFSSEGRRLTASPPRAVAHVTGPDGTAYMREQLSLRPGERVYGLGERFGPLTRNGQSVEIWNEDGGTASEQAYKNVPFYLTSAGYGVFG